jgi:hypothetical protein
VEGGVRVDIESALSALDDAFAGAFELDEPAQLDARDLNTPLNTWINNDCETDSPAGAICGIG